MSRIPRSLARRIDRLSLHAHRFHRFAHHPLCEEYAGELVRLGRRSRVCRGCLFTLLGGIAGCGLYLCVPMPRDPGWLLGASILWLVATVVGRISTTGRRSKAATRLFPAIGIAYGCCCALALGRWALAAGSAFILLGVLALYRKRGPDRAPCSTCPERLSAVPCRGFAPIVRRERAFRRLADSWLAKA